MKYLNIFIVMLCFVSCTKVKEQKTILPLSQVSDKEDMFFPQYYRKDTLYLNVSIDNCGEWGGPEDKFMIYKDSSRQYKLDFKRYKMNCDSIGEYYGKSKPLEYQKKLVLSSAGKKVISDFLVNIMRAKVEEYNRSNAGSIYEVFNNDSTLFVRVYSRGKRIEEDYYNLKKGLGLPENRKEESRRR